MVIDRIYSLEHSLTKRQYCQFMSYICARAAPIPIPFRAQHHVSTQRDGQSAADG